MTDKDFLNSQLARAAAALAQAAHPAENPSGVDAEHLAAEAIGAALWDALAAASLLATVGAVALSLERTVLSHRITGIVDALSRAMVDGSVQGGSLLFDAPWARPAANELGHALLSYMAAGASGPRTRLSGASALVPTPAQALRDPSASKWFVHALQAALQRDPVDAANGAEALARVLDRHVEDMLASASASLERRSSMRGG